VPSAILTGVSRRKDDTTMNMPVHSSMVMPSPIGQLLMEASPMGLVRVAFLTDEEAAALPPLSLGLNPNSTGSSILVAAASQLGAYFAGKRRGFDLPLDLKGTDFQRSVWRAVLKIPYGETRDVAWLATEAGTPASLLDVAQAGASTPSPSSFPVTGSPHRQAQKVATSVVRSGSSSCCATRGRLSALHGPHKVCEGRYGCLLPPPSSC
jgi:methylated-DNA-[protein]-cysteine S-methyltransferase